MNERTNEKAEILSWEKIEEKHEEFLKKEPRECAYEIAKECIDKYWREGEIPDEDLKKNYLLCINISICMEFHIL
jgi:hypothetical protein